MVVELQPTLLVFKVSHLLTLTDLDKIKRLLKNLQISTPLYGVMQHLYLN